MLVDVFFVEAPFQVLSAISATKNCSDSSTKKVLVFRNPEQIDDKNAEQLISIIDDNRYLWDEIIEIKPKYTFLYSKFLYWFFFALTLKKIVRKTPSKSINNLFIGNYKNEFLVRSAGIFKPKNLYILDDGISSVGLEKNYHFNEADFSEATTLQRKILLHLFSLVDLKVPNVPTIIYSFLDLEIYNKNLSYVKCESLLPNKMKESCLAENVGYILGSKFVELGFLTSEIYIAYLKKTLLKYPKVNFVYIPHRAEDKVNYSKVIDELEVGLLQTNLPIEMYLMKLNKLPSVIVSFYSAALVTLPAIFESIQYGSILLGEEDLNIDEKVYHSISSAYKLISQKVELI